MTADIKLQEKPWQEEPFLSPRSRLEIIFNNGYFSDLTITFPGKDEKYKAHKAILAMSSSIFEGMLFGPMAITSSELELPEDNPEAFKIILASCYGVCIDPSGIDVALEVYMLADKYFIAQSVQPWSNDIKNMIDSGNVNKVLEFATRFSFNSIKELCFEYLISSNASLSLQKNWLKKLIGSKIKIPKLVFEDSWKNPGKVLCEGTIIQILKSEKCPNKGLQIFSGCVSAKVLNNICWRTDIDPNEEEYNQLYISFTNLKQANKIISILDNVNYTEWIYIHLQCKKIPTGRLKRITRSPEKFYENETELFLSNVDDNGIDWVVSAITSLKRENGTFEAISFPRSELTFSGLINLMTQLATVFSNTIYPHIHVCSSVIPSHR